MRRIFNKVKRFFDRYSKRFIQAGILLVAVVAVVVYAKWYENWKLEQMIREAEIEDIHDYEYIDMMPLDDDAYVELELEGIDRVLGMEYKQFLGLGWEEVYHSEPEGEYDIVYECKQQSTGGTCLLSVQQSTDKITSLQCDTIDAEVPCELTLSNGFSLGVTEWADIKEQMGDRYGAYQSGKREFLSFVYGYTNMTLGDNPETGKLGYINIQRIAW